MPNWCSTEYTFYANTDEGRKQLADFAKRAKKAISSPANIPIKQGFGDGWLGNILMEFCPNLLTFNSGNVSCIYNGTDIRFRGWIDCIICSDESEENLQELEYVTIATETAWAPMSAMWRMILSVCGYTDIQFVLLAEEPGNGIYVNTDINRKFYEEYGVIDGELPSIGVIDDYRYFTSEQEMLEEMNKIIQDLHDQYAEHPEDYNLPDDFDPAILVKQNSIEDAGSLIEDHLYPLRSGDCDSPFFTYAVYESAWID